MEHALEAWGEKRLRAGDLHDPRVTAALPASGKGEEEAASHTCPREALANGVRTSLAPRASLPLTWGV